MNKVIFFCLIFFPFLVAAQVPIHEFGFDGTLVNQDKTATFYGNAQYTNDRAGNDKKAIRLVNEGLTANIGNLPQTKSPRTISIWIKFNDLSNSNYIWGYGAASNNLYCGLIHQGTSNNESPICVAAWGNKNDFVTTLPIEKGVWYQYTYTYDGKKGSLYRNGALIQSFSEPFRNTLGSIFKIGIVNTLVSINADIDDLKIYNVALTSEEISKQFAVDAASIKSEIPKIVAKKPNTTLPKKSNTSNILAAN